MQSARFARYQRGVSLSGLLLWGFVIALVALLTIKVVPEIVEYYSIVKVTKAMVKDPALREASVDELRLSFNKRRDIDNIHRIKAEDLDILKDGKRLEISFAYEAKIPLFDRVSLMIEFEGNSSQ